MLDEFRLELDDERLEDPERPLAPRAELLDPPRDELELLRLDDPPRLLLLLRPDDPLLLLLEAPPDRLDDELLRELPLLLLDPRPLLEPLLLLLELAILNLI